MENLKVSADLQEIFDDSDFDHILRVLSRELGDVTLGKVKQVYELYQPVPEHTIGDKTYYAGYRGRYMVPEGFIPCVELLNVTSTKAHVKLMFGFSHINPELYVFLYQNIDKESIGIDEALSYANSCGKYFDIEVKHTVIKNTGDKHAVVSSSKKRG